MGGRARVVWRLLGAAVALALAVGSAWAASGEAGASGRQPGRAGGGAAAGAGAWLAGAGPGAEPAASAATGPLDDGAARSEEERATLGREALDAAGAAKREAYALEGEARRAALLAAAAQYGRAADRDDLRAAERAEAAFRAGELLRAQDEPAQAEQRFAQATELGAGGEGGHFAARGLLERAHMRRRDGDVPGALALYEQVRTRFGDERKTAAQAMTWTGKMLLREGDREQGIALLVEFGAVYDELPIDAVRNVDLAALACIEAGETARARALLAELRTRLGARVDEPGRDGDRLRQALEAMDAPAHLEPEG